MISAVVIAKNEKGNIQKCLESLYWCDEVLVIDDFSSDGTFNICQKTGVETIRHSLDKDFSQQRNFALSKVKGEWVLFIDADERISPQLAKEIKKAIKQEDFGGFHLRRQDILWGQKIKHGETANVKLIRLGKKEKGKWQRKVHETWIIKGKIGKLKNPISHYPHQTITEFLQEMNFYSTLHAETLFEKGKHSSLAQIILYPEGKFFQNWIINRGFQDKIPGFIIAVMMSFHSFLARAKLYLKWKK